MTVVAGGREIRALKNCGCCITCVFVWVSVGGWRGCACMHVCVHKCYSHSTLLLSSSTLTNPVSRCCLGLVTLVFSVFLTAEGPCLVHTITGDLLRALEGPENCLFPRLISVSSEGHCIIYYERGRFSNFSINGKLLAQMEINDSTRVSTHQCWAARSHGNQTCLT